MTVLQAWLVAGIPGLVIALLLFLDRSPVRSALGYASLLLGFAGVTAVHPPSGAVFGGLIALLVAAGRGGGFDSEPIASYRERAGDDPETTEALRTT